MADGLLNKASIILTPTGYKAGTLYNVAPIDEPYEDFDFARTSTATRINSSGLVSNVATGVPRINYDSNGDNGHILLEPTSTNLIPYSEDFNNSSWTENNITLTSGFPSPNGTNNAYEMTDDDTDSKHGVYDLDLLSQDGNIYTRSVFVKKGTARYVVLSARHLPTSSGTSWIYDFDINNWTLIGSSGVGQSIEELANGWIRLSISHISNSNFNNDFSIGISSGATISDATYSGSGDTLYIWGAQVEELSHPTSYIPTLTGSTETRATETANGAGSAELINSTEGVLYAEIAALADDISGFRVLGISDGGSTNRIFIGYSSNNIYANVGSGTTIGSEYTPTNASNFHKVALKYENNNCKFFVDGSQIGSTTTSITIPSGLNSLQFDSGGGSSDFYGKCKALAVFNEALSDSELTQLTT